MNKMTEIPKYMLSENEELPNEVRVWRWRGWNMYKAYKVVNSVKNKFWRDSMIENGELFEIF